jgi:hypothetical protein
MRRLIVGLFGSAALLGLLGAASFVGAHFKARQLLGRRSPVRAPASTFAYQGVQDLRGRPRAWVLTYSQIRLPGVRRVRIVVSPTGRVLSVTPPDLKERIEAYRQSLEP